MRIAGRGRIAIATLCLVALASPLAGCSAGDDVPGQPSRDEDRQLNDAAAMLDANSVALEDAPDNGADRQ